MTVSDSTADLRPRGLESIGRCRVLRDVVEQPGIETVEGRLVPLMSGHGIRTHLIVMHPGQYCLPHPHDSESLIYTISGRWVFCTTEDGEVDGPEVRAEIRAGDVFHFVAGVPTGFETPFDETAVILILKGSGATYEEMVAAMRGARASLDAAAADGEPFSLDELPADHPARTFAAAER